MTEPLRILTVCTFNRVRSVAMTANLRAQLAERKINARVLGAGFQSANQPPTNEAIQALARFGHDVSRYRSRTVDSPIVRGADLIVTAESLHVMRLCEDDDASFTRTFTLPELVDRAEKAGPRAGRPMAQWLEQVGAGRTRANFLSDSIPEISDPTGLALEAIAASLGAIGDWCGRLADLL